MNYSVVLDTNVIVSALIDTDSNSNTVIIMKLFFDKRINILYSDEILEEYKDVLERKEFKFKKSDIGTLINLIKNRGIRITPAKLSEELKDKKDLPFYEIVMDTRNIDSKLITGNLKHFPKKPYIITPKQFVSAINN